MIAAAYSFEIQPCAARTVASIKRVTQH